MRPEERRRDRPPALEPRLDLVRRPARRPSPAPAGRRSRAPVRAPTRAARAPTSALPADRVVPRERRGEEQPLAAAVVGVAAVAVDAAARTGQLAADSLRGRLTISGSSAATTPNGTPSQQAPVESTVVRAALEPASRHVRARAAPRGRSRLARTSGRRRAAARRRRAPRTTAPSVDACSPPSNSSQQLKHLSRQLASR